MLVKKELEDATCIDTSNLASKRDFNDLKVEDDKLDINKLVNVLSGMDNLKTKVNDLLDIDKLKTVSVDLKKLSDAVSNKFAKNTKFNKPNTKVSDLEYKIPDASTSIQTNQYNADIQNSEKKNWRC